MSELDKLRGQASRALTDAAKNAVLGTSEDSRAKRKRWLALAGVAGGGLGLLFLWGLVSKLGFYLMVLLFISALGGGAYYLLKGKLETWRAQRLEHKRATHVEQSAADQRKALEAELEALKRKSR